MPDKVLLLADDRLVGMVTVFDSEPSFSLLITAFPEAKSITGCGCCGQFIVELGDASAMQWAD